MNLTLASTAELYAEHRRTESAKKKLKIADELQRRHDQVNCRPGYGSGWFTVVRLEEIILSANSVVHKPVYAPIARYNFRLFL